MRACVLRWLLLGLLGVAAAGQAEEPAPPAMSRIEQQLEALARIDEDLTRTEKQLRSSTARADRRRLRARLRELREAQAKLLGDLERLVGPLPPAIRHDPPSPLEEQLESQRRRHEAILERDVERRLAPQ